VLDVVSGTELQRTTRVHDIGRLIEQAGLELACVYKHGPNEKGIGQEMLFSLMNIYI
jgi:hypothetical protein